MKLFAVLGLTLTLGFAQEPPSPPSPPAPPPPTAPPAPTEADKAAGALLKKVEEKILNAKTLHIEFEGTPEGAAAAEMKLTGVVRIGEKGAFHAEYSMSQSTRVEKTTVRSDGAIIQAKSTRMSTDPTKWKPEAIARCMRVSATQANFMATILFQGSSDVTPETALEMFQAKDVKSDGSEKLDGVETSIVTFAVVLKQHGRETPITFKLWIDPAKLTILKRTASFGPMSLVEKTIRFDIDPAFPADYFEFQSAALLKEGLALQLAHSVRLHARYTGRVPKSLEALRTRPADLPADIFWPEGGFWIGGTIPKDIAYSSDAAHFTVGSIKEPIPTVSPVGAPTDRLKKHFSARVTVHLLKAACEGYAKSVSVIPKTESDLVAKSEIVKFWPEGGWIAGGKAPVDPWGVPYLVREGRARVSKSKGKILRFSDLTEEERKQLDAVAIPALPAPIAAEVRALIPKLGSESLEEREEAMRVIPTKDPGALHLLLEALAGEKNPEAVTRLRLLCEHFQKTPTTWRVECGGAANPGPNLGIDENQRIASRTLRTLTTAQADFRSNDRDGNRINDFWVQDVSGLFALEGATGTSTDAKPGSDGSRIIRLIEPMAAKADTTEDRWDYPVLGITEPEPYAGYYFSALKNQERGGNAEPYHKGSGRHQDCFGFVAYPEMYGTSGRMTYIVNEDNSIWEKDLGGAEVDTFPEKPAEAGWRRID